MTTVRQIKTLLAPLLARHDDLIDFGTYMVLKPVRHVARTIIVDRTSNADRPDFRWSLSYLFCPSQPASYWQESIYPPEGVQKLWSNPAMPEAFRTVVETKILPLLRPITEISNMLDFQGAYDSSYYTRGFNDMFVKPYMDAAFGRFDEALAQCRKFETWTCKGYGVRRRECECLVGEMLPLLEAKDRAGIASLLHRWEAATIKGWKLDRVHEVTPFPLELEAPA